MREKDTYSLNPSFVNSEDFGGSNSKETSTLQPITGSTPLLPHLEEAAKPLINKLTDKASNQRILNSKCPPS